MKFDLTPELKAALELRHRKIHDGHERDRIKQCYCAQKVGRLNTTTYRTYL